MKQTTVNTIFDTVLTVKVFALFKKAAVFFAKEAK